jgi:hypothetical protein
MRLAMHGSTIQWNGRPTFHVISQRIEGKGSIVVRRIMGSRTGRSVAFRSGLDSSRMELIDELTIWLLD